MSLVAPLKRRFVETSIHQQVHDAVQFSVTKRAVSLVVGRPGTGKTTSVRHIAETDRNSLLIEFKPRYRTVSGIYKAFMDARGFAYTYRNGYDLEAAAEDIVRSLAWDGCYFLVDEYQNFDLDAVRSVMRFNDDYGLPIVLVGNFARLRRTKIDTHTYEQITSRIWRTIQLDEPVRQDFIDIGIDFNVEGQSAYEELVSLGQSSSIREVVQILETARDLRGERGSLTVEHLREAVSFLTEGAAKLLTASGARAAS